MRDRVLMQVYATGLQRDRYRSTINSFSRFNSLSEVTRCLLDVFDAVAPYMDDEVLDRNAFRKEFIKVIKQIPIDKLMDDATAYDKEGL